MKYFYIAVGGGVGMILASIALGSYVLAEWIDTGFYYTLIFDGLNSSGVTLARAETSLGLVILIWLAPAFIAIAFVKGQVGGDYGEAAFATAREIKRAGLDKGKGIIVGVMPRKMPWALPKYIRAPFDAHVLVVAKTRGGKGVSSVIPNALSWTGSLVVVDLKAENWSITAGHRAAAGSACHRLNLAGDGGESACWNPLDYVEDERIVADLQQIAVMLYPANQGDPIWFEMPRQLFLSIALLVFETGVEDRSFAGILATLNRGEGFLREKSESEKVSYTCRAGLKSILDINDETKASIIGSFRTPLGIFADPRVSSVISSSSFDLREIRREKTSIYICITPNDIDRLAPLINLFLQQLISVNTKVLPENDPTLKHRVLLLADEFANLGRVVVLKKAISIMSGYGLNMLTIVQSISQLKDNDLYGNEGADTLIENHGAWVFLKVKNLGTAEMLSKIIGTKSSVSMSKSRSKGGASTSTATQSRSLMLAQEVMGLKNDEQLLLVDDIRPAKTKRAVWYKDSRFAGVANHPARDGQCEIINHPLPYVPGLGEVEAPEGVLPVAGEVFVNNLDTEDWAATIEKIGEAAIKTCEGDLECLMEHFI